MTTRIALIDDDPFVIAHLTRKFRERMPKVEVVGIIEPIAPFGFDVYIVDREFYGKHLGRDVIRRIRTVAPNSLILAYSAHLDREFLRGLLLEGCAGAFDKGSLNELESMIWVIEKFLADDFGTAKAVHGIGNTVLVISNLIREWNLRLKMSNRHSPKSERDRNV